MTATDLVVLGLDIGTVDHQILGPRQEGRWAAIGQTDQRLVARALGGKHA